MFDYRQFSNTFYLCLCLNQSIIHLSFYPCIFHLLSLSFYVIYFFFTQSFSLSLSVRVYHFIFIFEKLTSLMFVPFFYHDICLSKIAIEVILYFVWPISPVKCGPGIDPETRTQATDRANHSATSVPILIFCFWRYLCKVFLQAQSQRIRATDLYTGGPNLCQPNTNLFLIFLSKHRPRCSSFSLSLSVSVYQSVNLLSVCLLCLTPRHWRKSLVKARDMTCHEHKDILRGLKLCE